MKSSHNVRRSIVFLAYDSEKVRQQIRDEGALPVIPNRSTATKKAYCPKRFYRRRHKIENFFCRIKDWRRRSALLDQVVSPDPSNENAPAVKTITGQVVLADRWLSRTH
jgi:transposase